MIALLLLWDRHLPLTFIADCGRTRRPLRNCWFQTASCLHTLHSTDTTFHWQTRPIKREPFFCRSDVIQSQKWPYRRLSFPQTVVLAPSESTPSLNTEISIAWPHGDKKQKYLEPKYNSTIEKIHPSWFPDSSILIMQKPVPYTVIGEECILDSKCLSFYFLISLLLLISNYCLLPNQSFLA